MRTLIIENFAGLKLYS